MTVRPILASDMTAAFVSLLAILFWIAIVGGTIPGLLALRLYFANRNHRKWKAVGVVLGGCSISVGVSALAFIILFTARTEFYGWVCALIPLVIGVLSVIMWSGTRHAST
jgi:cadmium resistance protein CadD (predicted permease)